MYIGVTVNHMRSEYGSGIQSQTIKIDVPQELESLGDEFYKQIRDTQEQLRDTMEAKMVELLKQAKEASKVNTEEEAGV